MTALKSLAAVFITALVMAVALMVASPVSAQEDVNDSNELVESIEQVAADVAAADDLAQQDQGLVLPQAGIGTDTQPGVQTDTESQSDVTFSVDLGGEDGPRVPSQSVTLIILITLLAVAPSLLIMLTSFTRIVIVFSLLRNAIGLPTAPPNQVILGLSLFLSLFVMSPTLSESWDNGVKPFTEGTMEQAEAFDAAIEPFRDFMAANVGAGELELMLSASGVTEAPASVDEVPLQALIPAFILSELKTAFMIGFIIFIPFLVIDLVTSASLMSLGMMMMPPPMVSMPLKLLLLVMVDGWALVTTTLLTGFNT